MRSRTRPPAAERLDLDPRSPLWGEHRSRYHFAAARARNKDVLDIASGSGFGLRLLVDAGVRSVVGVDSSWDAIHESVPITLDGSSLCVADGTRLPMREASFSVVTSFETLEHVTDGPTFVRELRRVLTADGLLILSTPNATYSERRGGKKNPFHIREYSPSELSDLLATSFSTVEILGQETNPQNYAISPYWQLSDDLPTDARSRWRVLLWKLQNQMAFGVKDRLSRLLHNRAFYPGEYDFVFTPEGVANGHALLALCRP